MTSGGAKHPEFEGISVLVVDDDYYQATDAADAFAKVGATVIGPCGHVDQALASIESTAIDCAVVDLNLGFGASFDVPRCLKNRGIPLLIVTGYDESMLPPDLKGTSWLDKPVHRTALVRTMAQALRDACGALKIEHPGRTWSADQKAPALRLSTTGAQWRRHLPSGVRDGHNDRLWCGWISGSL